jgi:hypothetical protein
LTNSNRTKLNNSVKKCKTNMPKKEDNGKKKNKRNYTKFKILLMNLISLLPTKLNLRVKSMIKSKNKILFKKKLIL